MRNVNVELVTKEGSLAPINNARLRLKRLGGLFAKILIMVENVTAHSMVSVLDLDT